MAYTTINKSTDYFNTTLWTGDGNSTQNVTGTGFTSDFTWNKGRSGSGDHQLYDKVRGVQKMIISNSSNAESTNSIGLTAWSSNGFTVGSDMTGNGSTFVSWNWLANGAGSSNTDGSITSTVSASTTSGFSIVKYNGTGANATVGHGLGVAPKVIIVKNLDNGSGYEWIIGHSDLASGGTGFSANWYMNGFGTGTRNQNATASWNSTSPTNSVFSLHSGATYMNASGEANIAYCFAEKTGYSKFGSYEGNASTDGSFIYTGFKPAFVMMKGIDSGGSDNWNLCDNKRVGYNAANWRLYPNANAGENSTSLVDLLSNGFKLRVSSTDVNADAKTYIYMAFAEAPLVGSNNVPANAR